MTAFAVVILLLCFGGIRAAELKCSLGNDLQPFIWRRIVQNGLSCDMELTAELMTSGLKFPGLCTLLLINAIPDGAVVDPKELEDFQETELGSTVFLPNASRGNPNEVHTLLAYTPLKASEYFLKANVEFPFNLELKFPDDDVKKTVFVEFSPPEAFIRCEGVVLNQACVNLSLEAPCDASNSSLCSWVKLDYRTNPGPVAAELISGDAFLWPLLSFVAIGLTVYGLTYLVKYIQRKDEELLANEAKKLNLLCGKEE
ncbi:unnamed protein product [Notodromas monacha]|uniref:Phosphatidylinositol-glycan biosynthesis class X protein n=1 Tax=Notodromas monacha TaxID=399045 RepID=A0A7R9GHS2_9CRUS|nr:unnamed protein product [Notodromas monacha]CAG0923109.1 unnamed protein product [Notodromas monacha]